VYDKRIRKKDGGGRRKKMIKILKYLPLVAMGKNVRNSYLEETGKERPPYLSRRFVGAVTTLIGGFLAIHYGINISNENLSQVVDSVDKLISAGITFYGVLMTIWGTIDKQKNNKIEEV